MDAFVGPLTREHAPTALEMAWREISERQSQSKLASVDIDLGRVTAVDTASLALILALGRRARRDGFLLRWVHVPDALLHLARLSNVEELIVRP